MDIGEALRYLGAANPSEELRRQAAEIAGSIRETPRYTYRVFGVSRVPEGVSLEGCGVVLAGRMAETMLSECSQAALMACTLGAEFDRRLRAMQARDMSSAVITGSLLLNPMKSVTAVIGLSDRPQAARIRGCAYCRLQEDCPYRKGGTCCGEGM